MPHPSTDPQYLIPSAPPQVMAQVRSPDPHGAACKSCEHVVHMGGGTEDGLQPPVLRPDTSVTLCLDPRRTTFLGGGYNSGVLATVLMFIPRPLGIAAGNGRSMEETPAHFILGFQTAISPLALSSVSLSRLAQSHACAQTMVPCGCGVFSMAVHSVTSGY
ncbi:hypothetical protein PsYK624_076360 [Phanerochaete sordida]|uniref:Uncharacterized protein n=1 Tax=Phanerochaete sordida TaxID=48140 RepID=A0A9P3GB15_9APHY|nr:hypothetical protein PsYK624_076360 [Phanerochaete sordida]